MPKASILLKMAATVALLALAGCATPTAYGPAGPYQTDGYTDRQLTDTRWRVTFTGNSVTPRDQVEDYLMLRAAEVTLDSGHNYFRFDTRDTQTQTRTTAFSSGYYGPGAFWGRGWGFGSRWGGYYPYGGYFGGGFGYGGGMDIITTNRYQAYAEIVVLTDDEARNEPRSVDAKSVVQHLTPPPPPRRN
jgi:hypothetical protein